MPLGDLFWHSKQFRSKESSKDYTKGHQPSETASEKELSVPTAEIQTLLEVMGLSIGHC